MRTNLYCCRLRCMPRQHCRCCKPNAATCADADINQAGAQPYTCPPGYAPKPGSEMATPPSDDTCCMVGTILLVLEGAVILYYICPLCIS
jgi:hypothetical protein